MEKKLYTTALVEEVEENGEKTKLFVASDDVEDRQGEILSTDGWELSNYKKHPVILWSHDQYAPPIGKAEKIGFKTINGRKKLVYQPLFHLKNEMSRLIADLVNEGWLSASSVGFKPIEMDGNTYTKQELLEISFVNVPANPNALQLAYSKGYSEDTIKKLMPNIKESKMEETIDEKEEEKVEVKVEEEPVESEAPEEVKEVIGDKPVDETDAKLEEEKMICSYKKMPLSQEDSEWNAPSERKSADISDLKKMCAWCDEVDKRNSYKLTHHELSGYKTNLNGVKKAMARLMGADGGVDISDASKKIAYNHLKRHYADFDKEAPEFRIADEIIDKYVEGKGVEDTIKDLTKTVNVFLEEGKVKEFGDAVQELKNFTEKSLVEQKELNTESIEMMHKEVNGSMIDIKSYLDKFIEEQNKLNTDKAAVSETEKNNLDARLKGIEMNIRGLGEGIKPGDEGLEQRLMDIEQNVESIAKDLKSIANDIPSDEDVLGRDPKVVQEAKDMAIKRSLVVKAFNKSVEAINLINKSKE